jgi:hypothetical protein
MKGSAMWLPKGARARGMGKGEERAGRFWDVLMGGWEENKLYVFRSKETRNGSEAGEEIMVVV